MKPFGFSHIAKKIPYLSVFAKFAACFLLLGLAFRLFSSSYVEFSVPAFLLTESATRSFGDGGIPPRAHTLPPLAAPPPQVVVVKSEPPSQVEEKSRASSSQGNGKKCDLFVGDWLPNPTGPYYTNKTCSLIQGHQNCMTNRRPDTDYMYWRWKPRDCDLARFDARKFLDFMRDKSLAFIGDSIMRNHAQSLLCSLSEAEEAIEVYHDKGYKNMRWTFPNHNFTLSVVWSPFLSKATVFEDDDGVTSGITQLNLDELDPVWTEQLNNLDFILTAGGKWFLKTAIYYENNKAMGCHNCFGLNNITEVGFEYAYQKVINSTLKFIMSSSHNVVAFLRTTTPDHFENGAWDTGGYCNRTKPFKEGEINSTSVDEVMRKIELEEFDMASSSLSSPSSTLRLFDTTKLSMLRPDGHPGAYREFEPFAGKDKSAKVQNDCLHWCLPGPIDSWNDLMLKMLLS